MAALKDNASKDMAGPSEPAKFRVQNAIGNHERNIETVSELADDIALGIKISTSSSGQKSAIRAEGEPHEARLRTCPARSPLTDFANRGMRWLLLHVLLRQRLCTPPKFSNSSSHNFPPSTSLLLPT
jgi:hypothetical protein